MDEKKALQVLQELQNIAIQKGLFANVQTVNQVSMAITVLHNFVNLSKPKLDGNQQT